MVKTIYNGEYEKKAITDQFVENLGEMLEKDPDVIYLDADLMFAFGAGLWDLGDKYPERVIRCGIAEGNMVGTASSHVCNGNETDHSQLCFVCYQKSF